MFDSLNRVEISRAALRYNFRFCRARAGDAAVMAMVKTDGYGHGLVECARIFAGEGAAAFGVAEVAEGIALREAGLEQPVFVLAGLLPGMIPALLQYNLTPVVVDRLILPELSRQAQLSGGEIGLHLKVDAGMGRQGCLPAAVPGLVREIEALPALRLDGIMAHFPMTDDLDPANTRQVFDRFTGMIQDLADDVDIMLTGCCFHIANSGGLLRYSMTRLDMVRPGIALYGYYPEGEPGRTGAGPEALQPAMRFVTRIIQVRNVPAGTALGYGRTFTTGRATTLAVLPVGYANGYLRSLSNRAEVLVCGQRAPVVGRVSMNLTLVDVTDVEGPVEWGGEAVLLGRQGDETITADELASWMDTISYEVLCLFGNLNRRYYLD
ncbi:MAG: alanine racemase [Proteobacteria bacterium]|nr:alanine racemase [Pseudomonadota bacterium]